MEAMKNATVIGKVDLKPKAQPVSRKQGQHRKPQQPKVDEKFKGHPQSQMLSELQYLKGELRKKKDLLNSTGNHMLNLGIGIRKLLELLNELPLDIEQTNRLQTITSELGLDQLGL